VDNETGWCLVPIDQVEDSRGKITIVEKGKPFDFDIKRIFYLSNISPGQVRGFHSHKELKQLIICVKGSFKIKLINHKVTKVINMVETGDALLLDGPVWREMSDFSPDAVMLVLCDRVYDEDIVIRDYAEFLKNIREQYAF
jgi:dTDP-4-dehydrorhamnose 3,5-epimerase-like enzyme